MVVATPFKQERGEPEERTLVLLIGISNNPAYAKLGAPAADATAMYGALIDPKGCDLPDNDVTLLPEVEATSKSILEEIAAIAAGASEVDRIFIYFAGHGQRLTSDFGLIAWDTRPGDAEHPPVRGSEIGRTLSDTRAYGVLLVIDCCYGADFAEFVPAFFRSRQNSGYRVLLSSTRADQRSWETADGGSTFFSMYLRRCIDGSDPVGVIPGAIFLSDLVRHIANRVAAEVKKLDERYRQEQTFNGVYGTDPLVFRQARLTQSRILLLLARYSRRDLARFAAIGIVALLGVVSLASMTHYSILERSLFATSVGYWIDIDIGRWGTHAYGFPKPFWQSNLTRDDVVASSPLRNDGGIVNAPIEEPILPTLRKHLTLGGRVRLAYWAEDDNEARRGLQDLWKVDKSLTGAVHLLPRLARPEDLQWLADVETEAPNESVRAFALIAAAKIAPDDPASGFRQSKREPYTLPMELLSVATPPCNKAVGDYIVSLLGKVPSEDYRSAGLSAALRLRCDIPLDALPMMLIYSFGLFAAEDIAGYIDSRQSSSDQLMAMLPKFATADPEKSDLPKKALAVMALSTRAPCEPSLNGQFGASDPDTRAMAVAALLAHCDASVAREIKAAMPLTPEVVAILAMHRLISADDVRSRLAEKNLDVDDASFLLVALGAVGSDEDIARIQDFVAQRPDEEEGVRIAAVLALHRLRAPVSSAVRFLDTIFESTKFTLDWIVDVAPLDAVRLMREAFRNHKGEPFVRFARRLPLSPADIEFLQNALKTEDAAMVAGILAQVQPAEKVVELLSSPDRRIRSAAATWASANPQISEEILQTCRTPFPSGEVRQLRGDLQLRKMIVDLLEEASPDTWAWRSKLLFATWRPQFRGGILQLLETYRRGTAMQDFWAIRGSSP
jgi:hypothetical protein